MGAVCGSAQEVVMVIKAKEVTRVQKSRTSLDLRVEELEAEEKKKARRQSIQHTMIRNLSRLKPKLDQLAPL
jgi:hypothetical protein